MSSHERLLSVFIIFSAAIVFAPVSAWSQSIDQKSSAGAISGRVTLGGKPAAGIPVAGINTETFMRRLPSAKSVTDADGRYRLSGLQPGQYQITSLTPDLTASDQTQETNFGFGFYSASKTVTLAPSEQVENIDLKLVRGSVITGRVTDADNKPVIEERITLIPVDSNGNALRTQMRFPFTTEMYLTDDRGVYRIYGLPAGRYKVSVGVESGGGINFAGRRFYPRTFHPQSPDLMKAEVVELSEGTEATNIDIQVVQSEQAYRASGRIVDAETGQPVIGARVSLMIAPQNPERYAPFYAGAFSGPRGEFQVNGLAPGRYGAHLSSDFEGAEYISEIVYFEIIDKEVAGIEIKATRGLTLSGLVVLESGVPQEMEAKLARLRILASGTQPNNPRLPNHGQSAIAQDGSFLIRGLSPGRVSIAVYPFNSPASRPTITRIEHAGVAVTPDLELRPRQPMSDLRVFISYGTGKIVGSVRFEGGVLPPNTRVIVQCTRDGRDHGASLLDARGRFSIKDLSTGTYEVTLRVFQTSNTPRPNLIGTPQKQIVAVSNDAESEVNFVFDLRPKENP